MDPVPHRSFPLPHPLPHPVPHYLVMCHFDWSVLDYQWTILDRLPVMHLITLPDIRRLSSLRLSVKVEHTLCHSLSGRKTQSWLISLVPNMLTSHQPHLHPVQSIHPSIHPVRLHPSIRPAVISLIASRLSSLVSLISFSLSLCLPLSIHPSESLSCPSVSPSPLALLCHARALHIWPAHQPLNMITLSRHSRGSG